MDSHDVQLKPIDSVFRERLVFDALIKEAEFVRSETLLVIENVRRLAVYSTYIAGFGLPIIASLLTVGDSATQGSPKEAILSAMGQNTLIIQFLCLGVSICCLAFLRIYVGNFLQIFNFARYYREYLSPSINKFCHYADLKLLYWEQWLATNRKRHAFAVGDSLLTAEPILIALYSLSYGFMFLFISYLSGNLFWFSVAFFAFATAVIIQTFIRFVLILKSSTR
jgi:hypothetical protein